MAALELGTKLKPTWEDFGSPLLIHFQKTTIGETTLPIIFDKEREETYILTKAQYLERYRSANKKKEERKWYDMLSELRINWCEGVAQTTAFQRDLSQLKESSENAWIVGVPIARVTLNVISESRDVVKHMQSFALCSHPMDLENMENMFVTHGGFVLIPLTRRDVQFAHKQSWTKLTRLLKGVCEKATVLDTVTISSAMWRIAAMREIARVKEVYGVPESVFTSTEHAVTVCLPLPAGAPHIMIVQDSKP